MGAAPGGAAGEAWGYRQLPLAVGAVDAGSGPLAFGSQPNPSSPSKQLAFLRYTDSTGWQVFRTPVDSNGNPYRGPAPNRLSARITRAGGGVLVGRDPNRPSGEQAVVLDHEPDGSWRALEAPPPTVLLPAEGGEPAEALAGENGSGAVADAAFDEGGNTGLLLAPKGRAVEDAVLHYDGEGWSRESVQVPAGSDASFHILAIDATGLGNAWAIAEADPSLGRSFVLLERTSDPRRSALGRARHRRRQVRRSRHPGGGDLRPGPDRRRRAAADGHLRRGLDRPHRHDRRRPARRDDLLRYRRRRGDGSWCDAAACSARSESSSRASSATAASPGRARASARG